MYAVFQIGNKQYKVFNTQIIYIDRVKANVGDQLEFNQILFVKINDFFQIGNPFIKKIQIIATVLDHNLGQKINIIKFRRRKHSRKSQGYRQHITKIKIVNINSI